MRSPDPQYLIRCNGHRKGPRAAFDVGRYQDAVAEHESVPRIPSGPKISRGRCGTDEERPVRE